ncbi:MAG TPA: AraC family transcriptional regulator [Opitutaceae bacterium]|nr:AraC family transcriptional regulator [Opitutaceae bacterium]
MDKIARRDPRRLLSRQVTGARYFFLNLAPRPAAPLALVMGGLEHCNPDYVIARRDFPFFALEYVVSGEGSVALNHRRHPLRPGAVFAYAPTMPCEIHTDPENRLVKYFLTFAGTDGIRRLRQCGVAPGSVRLLAARAELVDVLEDLLREGRRSGDLAGRICETLFDLLLLKIKDASTLISTTAEPALEAFLRCKALVDAEAERLGTLEEIARAAGVQASSVCRWFRRYQGTSPYQYLLRRKMNLAAEHLVQAGGLVKEVAARVGFSDPYHFSRCFKSVHGVAPRDLLRYQQKNGVERRGRVTGDR